ncbi:7721_t:CDS:1, partial [Ambispora gerdemannii]
MRRYKLLVLGGSNVGKKSLTIQFCLNHFIGKNDPIADNSYKKNVVIGDEQCTLEILYTLGPEYAKVHGEWIREYEGFLIVYSISSRSTFEQIEELRNQIIRIKKTDSVPIVIVGNKCDKMTEREVLREDGMNMSRRLGCEFVETSAKTCVNVERAFHTVVRMIRSGRE